MRVNVRLLKRLLSFPVTEREERALGEKRPQGFYFPRLLCKREINREEVAHYLSTGETKVFSDFVSKSGRNFSAKLVMEDDWTGFRFEFPPRARKKT